MLPVDLVAGQLAVSQIHQGRENQSPDCPAFAHQGVRTRQGPCQRRVVAEVAHAFHSRVVHVAHAALSVHSHPEGVGTAAGGVRGAVGLNVPGCDVPSNVGCRTKALRNGEQHFRLSARKVLDRGTRGAERHVHGPFVTAQMELSCMILRQVQVGSRRLSLGHRIAVLSQNRRQEKQLTEAKP